MPLFRYPPKQKREARILLLLAKTGPLNKYHIWKQLAPQKKETEPTILQAIQDLDKRGDIRVVDIKEKVRGPKPSKYFDLSFHGLMTLIMLTSQTDLGIKDFDSFSAQLANKYHELEPSFKPIFELWPAVIQAGVQDLAWFRLVLLCGATLRNPITWEESKLRGFMGYPTSRPIDFFLDPFGYTSQERDRWLSAVRKNDILRQAMTDSLQRRVQDYSNQINNMLEMLKSEGLSAS